jgi:hypothetical protein
MGKQAVNPLYERDNGAKRDTTNALLWFTLVVYAQDAQENHEKHHKAIAPRKPLI